MKAEAHVIRHTGQAEGCSVRVQMKAEAHVLKHTGQAEGCSVDKYGSLRGVEYKGLVFGIS